MIHAQNVKPVQIIRPVSLNDATATSIIVDTRGFGYADVQISIGASAGTLTVLKLQEDDASDGNTASDITGAAITGSDLPGTDSDGDMLSIKLPLGGNRKRYLKLVCTASDTGAILVGAAVQLSRAAEAPATATARGLAAEVIL
jgi:hypothetical protein